MVTAKRTDEDILREFMEAEEADAPASLKKKEILRRGTEDTDTELGDSTMIVNDIIEPGYALIYDVKTGLSSRVLKYRLFDYLRRVRADGSKVFTTDKSKVPPPPARPYKCRLREDDPERERFASWGFPICEQIGFLSQQDMNMHMERKHTHQWRVIEQERVALQQEEDRRLQRELLKAQLKAAKVQTRKPRKAS